MLSVDPISSGAIKNSVRVQPRFAANECSPKPGVTDAEMLDLMRRRFRFPECETQMQLLGNLQMLNVYYNRKSTSVGQLAQHFYEGEAKRYNYKGFNVVNIQKKLAEALVVLQNRGYLQLERSFLQSFNPKLWFKRQEFFWFNEQMIQDVVSDDRKGDHIARLRIRLTEKGKTALLLYVKNWSR